MALLAFRFFRHPVYNLWLKRAKCVIQHNNTTKQCAVLQWQESSLEEQKEKPYYIQDGLEQVYEIWHRTIHKLLGA